MKADIFNLTKITYVLVFGASISNLATGILEPTVAPYLEILGASSQEIGMILSARFLVISLASLPLALFASRFGLKRFLYLSSIGIIFGGLVLNVIKGKDAIYWLYLSVGFVSAIFSGPGTALIAENRGTKRITAFSLYFATWMIPTALGALISTVWFEIRNIPENLQYTPENLASIFPLVAYLLIGGSVIFVLLLSLVNHEESIDNSTYPSNNLKTVPIKNQFQILFTPIIAVPFCLLLFSELLSGAGAGSSLPYLTPYLKSLDANPGELSLLVFIMNIFMGIATQLPPILSKWFGDLRVYTVTMSLSVICLIGMLITNDLLVASVFFIFRGTFANMNAPIAQSRILTFIETRVRATGAATASTIRWVGWSMFSPISGSLIDDYGYNVAFIFTSVIYIIALGIFMFTVRRFKSLEKIKAESV